MLRFLCVAYGADGSTTEQVRGGYSSRATCRRGWMRMCDAFGIDRTHGISVTLVEQGS
jgi:hypothetical protein